MYYVEVRGRHDSAFKSHVAAEDRAKQINKKAGSKDKPARIAEVVPSGTVLMQQGKM